MMTDELEALARKVEAQRPPIPAELLRAQRQRLLADPRARVRGARRGSVILASGALALSLAAAVAFIALRADPPAAAPSEARATPSVPEPAERRLEDGTWIRLDSGARGELAEATADDVRFELQRGRADFDVTPHRARTFRVVAGEYEVRVLGTRFSVEYEPAAGLAVSVARGAVSVAAPGRASTRLEAGDRLAVTEGRWAIERSAGELPVPADAGSAHASQAAAKVAPIRERVRNAPIPDRIENEPSVLPTRRDPSLDWRPLYVAGDYAGALRKARDVGLERLALRLDRAALADLADSARLGGDPSAALLLLGALERRFADSEAASRASFLAGRLLAQQERHAEAISAFERYLERHPDGTYAGETRGRLMQTYAAAGEQRRARAQAEVYLARYPEGPYRLLASSLIAGQ